MSGYGTLPDFSREEKDANEANGYKMTVIFTFVPLIIGFGIACAIYFPTKDTYDTKIDAQGKDASWTFLSALVFSLMAGFINGYPTIFKGRVMPKEGDIRANMLLYKTAKTGELVVLDQEDEDNAKYNRANRSLGHFAETVAPVVLSLGFLSACFPIPIFVIVCVYAIGRMKHQTGYTHGGYGFQGHAPGFLVTMFAMQTLNGLLLVAAIRGFGGW